MAHARRRATGCCWPDATRPPQDPPRRRCPIANQQLTWVPRWMPRPSTAGLLRGRRRQLPARRRRGRQRWEPAFSWSCWCRAVHRFAARHRRRAGTGGHLAAWIDRNGDGVWADYTDAEGIHLRAGARRSGGERRNVASVSRFRPRGIEAGRDLHAVAAGELVQFFSDGHSQRRSGGDYRAGARGRHRDDQRLEVRRLQRARRGTTRVRRCSCRTST